MLKMLIKIMVLLISLYSQLSFSQWQYPYYISNVVYSEEQNLITEININLYYSYDDTLLVDLSPFMIINEFEGEISMWGGRFGPNRLYVLDLRLSHIITGRYHFKFSDFPELLVLYPRTNVSIKVKNLSLNFDGDFKLFTIVHYSKIDCFLNYLRSNEVEYPVEKFKTGDQIMSATYPSIIPPEGNIDIEKLFETCFVESFSIAY